MLTQKQMIKLGLYAERVHRLAFDVALSASELGHFGAGMAVIADETRAIGIKLHSYFDEEKLDMESLLDTLLQLKYLSVNACIETARLHESQSHLKKRLNVVFDEVRNAVHDIESLFNITEDVSHPYLRVSPASTVQTEYSLFAIFNIGRKLFTESIKNIQEVLVYNNELVEGGYLLLRGMKVPIIGKSLLGEAAPKSIIVVSTNYNSDPKAYAILLDAPPVIIGNRSGVSAQPKSTAAAVCAGIIRECWSCEEDLEMLFLDYEKL